MNTQRKNKNKSKNKNKKHIEQHRNARGNAHTRDESKFARAHAPLILVALITSRQRSFEGRPVRPSGPSGRPAGGRLSFLLQMFRLIRPAHPNQTQIISPLGGVGACHGVCLRSFLSSLVVLSISFFFVCVSRAHCCGPGPRFLCDFFFFFSIRFAPLFIPSLSHLCELTFRRGTTVNPARVAGRRRWPAATVNTGSAAPGSTIE